MGRRQKGSAWEVNVLNVRTYSCRPSWPRLQKKNPNQRRQSTPKRSLLSSCNLVELGQIKKISFYLSGLDNWKLRIPRRERECYINCVLWREQTMPILWNRIFVAVSFPSNRMHNLSLMFKKSDTILTRQQCYYAHIKIAAFLFYHHLIFRIKSRGKNKKKNFSFRTIVNVTLKASVETLQVLIS